MASLRCRWVLSPSLRMTTHDDRGVASPTLDAQNEKGEGDPMAMTELHAGMGGCWEVAARTSRHVWDLDAMRYTRLPGPTATAMEYDGIAVAIGRVAVWPVVGRQSLLFFDDPNESSQEQYRVCSTIESITAIPTGPPMEPS